MAGSIEAFFSAWGAGDDQRDALIKGAVAQNVTYTDPRGAVEGAEALCAYVAQFTAGAPGAAAEVAEQVHQGDKHSVRVRFFGDGWEQFGAYEATLNADGRIATLAGVAEKSA